MPRVVHFEISAKDPERASKFYSNVFDWKINKWDGPMPYWLVSTGDKEQPGIDGGIINAAADFPPIVNTMEVTSVDEYVDKIKKGGGKVVKPKMAIPGVGYMAYCQDTEGNIFGIMQTDTKAS
jgi:predicted enzyme related to lactoylglutathione lyase